MQLKPLGDRVLVEPLIKDDITPGGVHLPEIAKEKPVMGKVLAVGPGLVNDSGVCIKTIVQVGDTVLYANYAGNEVKLNDSKMLVLRESDILAIVKQ